MDDNNNQTQEVIGNQRLASTHSNLVFMAVVFAGLVVVGEGWAVVLEDYRNLGGSVLAWLVCGLLVFIGVLVLWGSYVQALTWRDVLKGSQRKGELVAMIVVMVVAGAFGAALGSSLDWRLEWTSGVSVEGKAREWQYTQGFLGWMLAVSAVMVVWTILAELRIEQKKATT